MLVLLDASGAYKPAQSSKDLLSQDVQNTKGNIGNTILVHFASNFYLRVPCRNTYTPSGAYKHVHAFRRLQTSAELSYLKTSKTPREILETPCWFWARFLGPSRVVLFWAESAERTGSQRKLLTNCCNK